MQSKRSFDIYPITGMICVNFHFDPYSRLQLAFVHDSSYIVKARLQICFQIKPEKV